MMLSRSAEISSLIVTSPHKTKCTRNPRIRQHFYEYDDDDDDDHDWAMFGDSGIVDRRSFDPLHGTITTRISLALSNWFLFCSAFNIHAHLTSIFIQIVSSHRRRWRSVARVTLKKICSFCNRSWMFAFSRSHTFRLIRLVTHVVLLFFCHSLNCIWNVAISLHFDLIYWTWVSSQINCPFLVNLKLIKTRNWFFHSLSKLIINRRI